MTDLARRRQDHPAGTPVQFAGPRRSLTGALKLMEFEDAPPLSFVEGLGHGKLLDDPATVARHNLTFDLLQAAALSPQDSLALIESVAQDYDMETNVREYDPTPATWRKSSYSGGEGGNCLEVATATPPPSPSGTPRTPAP